MNISERLDEIQARANATAIRDDLLPMVLSYAASEGLSMQGAIQAGLRMGAESALCDVPDMIATLKRVEALLAEYEKDDQEHLNTFGQHHPYAGWAADHLREALTGEA